MYSTFSYRKLEDLHYTYYMQFCTITQIVADSWLNIVFFMLIVYKKFAWYYSSVILFDVSENINLEFYVLYIFISCVVCKVSKNTF